MQQVKWFDRKFNFDTNDNIFPSLMVRLEGTPIRLRHYISELDSTVAEVKPAGTWSVKEHIGHLTDLEPLWQGRLVDILSGSDYMREADLENTKTHEAQHNIRSLEELVDDFERERERTMSSLRRLHRADVRKASRHPRLNTNMTIQNLFQFLAEHDDHHLVSITEIVRMMAPAES